MAQVWKPTKYDEDGQPGAYGWVEDGVDNPDYVQVGESWVPKANLPKASAGANLVPYTGQSVGDTWWNTGQSGATTLKAYSPSGGITKLVQGPDGSPMVELPSDWQAGGHVTDSGPGWMDKLVQAAATTAIGGGLASGFGLGPLAGGADIGAGLDTSGFGAYEAGAFNAGSAGGAAGGGLADLAGEQYANLTDTGTMTDAGGGDWDWLNEGADTSWGNGDLIDRGGATISGSGLEAGFGDVTLAAGSTAPSGFAGSSVYGDPMTILKQINNGTLPLSALFGGGADGIFGPTQPGGGNTNLAASLIPALLGYWSQSNMADTLTDITNRASERADPFASQRGFYQGELQKLYTDPNALMNNSLFSGARDQAMNQAQRMLASKGYSGSGNEALQMMKAGTNAQMQYAIPWLQQTATNAGAGFGPGAAGNIAQTGGTAAANATNNAYGNLGYGLNALMGGNDGQSSLDKLYGRIGQNVLNNMTGSSGSGLNLRT